MVNMRVKAVLAVLAGISLAGPAAAQSRQETPSSRLSRVERDLREIESELNRARRAERPVTVQFGSAESIVAMLEPKLDDVEATLTRVEGAIETLTAETQELRNQAKGPSAEELRALNQRIETLERALIEVTAAAVARSSAP